LMPNRVLRESIRSSETLDQLSAEAERMFYRLLTEADDFGRFKADERLLLAALFPLRVADWLPAQVATWRDELQTVGLIQLYRVDGRLFGVFVNWDRFNVKRAASSKCPAPDDTDPLTPIPGVRTSASNGERMQSSATIAHTRGRARPHSETSGSARSEKREARAARAREGWPVGFELTPERRAVAERKGLDAAGEWEAFGALANSREQTSADWDAEWVLWCHRAVTFQQVELPVEAASDPHVNQPQSADEHSRAFAAAVVCPAGVDWPVKVRWMSQSWRTDLFANQAEAQAGFEAWLAKQPAKAKATA